MITYADQYVDGFSLQGSMATIRVKSTAQIVELSGKITRKFVKSYWGWKMHTST